MDVGLIVLGVVGLAVVLAFMHVVSRMASERDGGTRRREKAARRREQRIVPFSDDTITHLGHS